MSLSVHEIGLGLSIDDLAHIIPCSGSPGGDSGALDAAPRSSLAQDYTNGKLYIKATAGTGADKWSEVVSGNSNATEIGYVQSFIGKSGSGVETPSYSNYAHTGGQTVSLESAIGSLDADLDKAYHVASASAVTTEVVLDSISVDNYSRAEWVVTAKDPLTGDFYSLRVYAQHNGTATADASVTDIGAADILRKNKPTGFSWTVDLSGATTTQVMNLKVSSTTSVAVKAVRMAL
jgi:hypothetical protein